MKKEDIDKIANLFPKNPGILARNRYLNSAVLVPLVLINDEYHLLFQKRAQGIRQEFEICFPGGKFDESTDISFEDTAVRETCEELGIDKDKITVIGQIDTLVTPVGVVVETFVAVLNINGMDDLDINKDEVEFVFSVPVSFFKEENIVRYSIRVEMHPYIIDEEGNKKDTFPAKELGLPELYHDSWHVSDHRAITYKTDYGVIWGITAEIVNDLSILISSLKGK